jgi:hypothetical protein
MDEGSGINDKTTEKFSINLKYKDFQPAGCTLPRPEKRPGEAGEPSIPLDK